MGVDASGHVGDGGGAVRDGSGARSGERITVVGREGVNADGELFPRPEQ